MLFPTEADQKDKPGRFHRVQENGSSLWQCDSCGKQFPEYQQIIGHMVAHPRAGHRPRPTGRPSNVMAKDPMAMTIVEMIETIERLREKVREAEEEGREAIAWKDKVQALFNVSDD